MSHQLQAVDRIMRTAREYGLLGNVEDAHYIMYTLDAARRAGLVEQTHGPRTSKQGKGASSGDTDCLVNTGSTIFVLAGEQAKLKGHQV